MCFFLENFVHPFLFFFFCYCTTLTLSQHPGITPVTTVHLDGNFCPSFFSLIVRTTCVYNFLLYKSYSALDVRNDLCMKNVWFTVMFSFCGNTDFLDIWVVTKIVAQAQKAVGLQLLVAYNFSLSGWSHWTCGPSTFSPLWMLLCCQWLVCVVHRSCLSQILFQLELIMACLGLATIFVW